MQNMCQRDKIYIPSIKIHLLIFCENFKVIGLAVPEKVCSPTGDSLHIVS